MDKNYLKAVSCFDFDEYNNNSNRKSIEFKPNDNLNYCGLAPCQYYTSSPEIAETISNTPWRKGTKSFPFLMEVLKCSDKGIQIITVDGEWRRRQFGNSLETWWGEWVNIKKTIDDILANENIQKFLTENWDGYMVINKNYLHKREWRGDKVTIDEVIKQIKTGSAKIYRNKLI
jgi:hypothetical protein